jgi:hypothetical protein
MSPRVRRPDRGQAMVELALVLPLFLMILFGIIILGIGVFYQQQVTNAAREAARYASISSGTAQCPTASHLDPRAGGMDPVSGRTSAGLAPDSYTPCDSPASYWPKMTTAGRSKLFGINAAAVNIGACWSGYVTINQYDAPPPDSQDPPVASTWGQCHLLASDGTSLVDPTDNPRACAPGETASDCVPCLPSMADYGVDTASDISEGPGRNVANTVTAYSCYVWQPPLAGFLLIPKTITLHAVITEPMERQQ